MFGRGRKRIALIKELVEQRINGRGASSLEGRLMIKSLNSFKAMSLPEATIVVIVEAIVKGQMAGIPLSAILQRLEKQRSASGHYPSVFSSILETAEGHNPASAMIDYLAYRNNIEAPPEGQLDYGEVSQMAEIAYMQIRSW